MTMITTDDLNGTSCEATGHPSECTEPVPGVVQGTSHSVTVNTANGDEKPIATKSSTLHFDSHSHNYDSQTDSCGDNASHDLTGSDLDASKMSSSLNINGSPVMIVASGVSTDPKTGGDVNVTSSGVNNSVSIS